ncbi:MAG: DUF4358 domain-containing protein [Lachnospiraceae bacterium]|nr:DUF4358 domain-containing protein [Lachnospiraceae bacterium]
MRKRLLALIMALSLAAGSTSYVPALNDGVSVAEAAKKKVKTPSIKKIRKAVVNTFGENYVADVALTSEEIKAKYGISPSWYTDAVAEVPMISSHVDTFIAVKAKNKNTKKKIKKKLSDYRKALVADTMQYPMNIPKIQASRVYVKDNYLFFIMLGFIDSSLEETGTDEQMIEAYKAENQKAVDAIKALFK